MKYIVDEVLFYCNVSVSKCKKMLAQKISFFDLTIVLEGQLTYIADGKKYTLNKNDAIFLKPDTLRARIDGNSPVHYVSFNFTAQEDRIPLDTLLQNCINDDIFRLLSIFPSSHLVGTFHSKEKCASMLNYILFELIDIASLKTKNTHIIRMIKYIDENISKKLTLSQISREVNLSKEYASYIFSKEMGKSVTEYINERKLLLARELICGNEKISLSDVAEHLGFENYNYFSRLFKEKFGVTAIYFKTKNNR